MQIFISILISALMVLGSMAYTQEKAPSLGASQSISSLTAKTTLQGDDTMVIVDTSVSPATTKKITVTNATTSMKAYNDLTYQSLLVNSAGLRSALSDETGTSLSVFSDTPTLSTPILNSATVTTPYINVSGTEAKGDMLYLSDNGGTLSRIAIGSTGNLLSVSGGIPSWTDISSSAITLGGFLSTASSTINATTTISADNLLNRALVLNGLAYRFPTARAASSSVLATDASGNLMFAPSGIQFNYASTTATVVTNGTATGTAMNIPAGTLTGSSTIAIKYITKITNTASAVGSCTAELRTSLGASIFSASVGSTIAAADTINGEIDANMVLNNSLSSEKIIGKGVGFRSGTINAVVATYWSSIVQSTSVDFTSSVSIVPVITSSAANVACELSGYSFIVNP